MLSLLINFHMNNNFFLNDYTMAIRQFFSPFNEINRSLNYKLNKNKKKPE